MFVLHTMRSGGTGFGKYAKRKEIKGWTRNLVVSGVDYLSRAAEKWAGVPNEEMTRDRLSAHSKGEKPWIIKALLVFGAHPSDASLNSCFGYN